MPLRQVWNSGHASSSTDAGHACRSTDTPNPDLTELNVDDTWDLFEDMFPALGAEVFNDPIEEALSDVSMEDNDSDDEDVFKLRERSAEDLRTECESCFSYRWKLAAEALSKNASRSAVIIASRFGRHECGVEKL